MRINVMKERLFNVFDPTLTKGAVAGAASYGFHEVQTDLSQTRATAEIVNNMVGETLIEQAGTVLGIVPADWAAYASIGTLCFFLISIFLALPKFIDVTVDLFGRAHSAWLWVRNNFKR